MPLTSSVPQAPAVCIPGCADREGPVQVAVKLSRSWKENWLSGSGMAASATGRSILPQADLWRGQ